MISRRSFLKNSAGFLGALSIVSLPFETQSDDEEIKITLLHTNDTHSRIEPFPNDGRRNGGLGGIARRAAIIKKIRKEEKNILLVDAGDILQGTPYFNFFKGEVEFKLMSEMGYDASTIGNHEFDNGVEALAGQLHHAKFPFINSNYDFSNTAMKGKTQPTMVFEKEGVIVGIFGLGIELNGLVTKELCKDVVYQDPIAIARDQVNFLRKQKKADIVICLSHLGLRYEDDKIDDIKLAKKVDGIDIIIGGHTHTFLDRPIEVESPNGLKVLINQVGFGGINLGRIDIFLKKISRKKTFASTLIEINKNSC